MADKPGRNDPCPCGSGEKYKHCCQGKDTTPRSSKMIIAAVIIALIIGVGVVVISQTGENERPECPAGTVWSEAHQHCH